MASEVKFADSEHRTYSFEHNKDIQDDLMTKFNKAKAKLKSYEEQAHFLEDQASE